MANRENPYGLMPVGRTLDGGEPRLQALSRDASEVTALFIWDVVNRETDGYLADGGTPGTTTYYTTASTSTMGRRNRNQSLRHHVAWRFVCRPDNAHGANADIVVTINKHRLNAGAAVELLGKHRGG